MLMIGATVWGIRPAHVLSQSVEPEMVAPKWVVTGSPVRVTIEYGNSSAPGLEYRFDLSDGRTSGWMTTRDTSFTFTDAGVYVVWGSVGVAGGRELGAATDSIRVLDSALLSFGAVQKPPVPPRDQISRWLLLLLLLFLVIVVAIEASSELMRTADPPRVSVRSSAAAASARMEG
ncbi:MAG: hypothetical protein HKN17_08935, partial [Rhodothermales bacterium]|nr:hypothetical protein [Rhodothermales bacterium]